MDAIICMCVVQVLRIRILDEVPDKMEAEAEAEDTMEADDVAMLKQLEKNLLRLQLSGIAGISKVSRLFRYRGRCSCYRFNGVR